MTAVVWIVLAVVATGLVACVALVFSVLGWMYNRHDKRTHVDVIVHDERFDGKQLSPQASCTVHELRPHEIIAVVRSKQATQFFEVTSDRTLTPLSNTHFTSYIHAHRRVNRVRAATKHSSTCSNLNGVTAMDDNLNVLATCDATESFIGRGDGNFIQVYFSDPVQGTTRLRSYSADVVSLVQNLTYFDRYSLSRTDSIVNDGSNRCTPVLSTVSTGSDDSGNTYAEFVFPVSASDASTVQPLSWVTDSLWSFFFDGSGKLDPDEPCGA